MKNPNALTPNELKALDEAGALLEELTQMLKKFNDGHPELFTTNTVN